MASGHRLRLTRPDWHSARHEAFLAGTPLPAVEVPLGAAIGATAASDIVARCDVPHYASSAMDGWTVAGSGPWRLVSAERLSNGEARAIVTGGLVPDGALGILRSEHGTVTEVDGGAVLDRSAAARSDEPGDREHVRPAGEEVTRGETVIRAGTVMNPAHIAVAAVCGHDELPVLPKPRLALVLTGDEVVDRGIPTPGHVRDSFGPQLPAFVAMLGGQVVSSRRLPDDLAVLIAEIDELSDAEVIITTGGTGTSTVDHLRTALDRLGARLVIDGVAMRPGGPSLLAELPDGRFLVGLPGNPLAAMMGMFTLARPLIAALAGASEPSLGSVTAERELAGRAGVSTLLPYHLQNGAVQQSVWFGSGMLRGLAEADGVLIVPPSGVRPGETVQTIPLPW
jgi:molybdopterin molybdotransferase